MSGGDALLILALLCLVAGLVFDLLRTIFLVISGKIMAVKTVPYERMLKGAKNRFLFIGDSTVVGVGAKTPGESIAGRFGADFPDSAIINRGVSGRKIGELAKQFNPKEFKNIDLLVIQIGGNDIVHPMRLKNTRYYLRMLLGKAITVSPRILILHCGNAGASPFWPWYMATMMEYRTLIVREVFQSVALEFPTVHYVDLYRDIHDDPFLPDVKRFYARDMFHPAGPGYEIWYLHLRETMNRLSWDFNENSFRKSVRNGVFRLKSRKK